MYSHRGSRRSPSGLPHSPSHLYHDQLIGRLLWIVESVLAGIMRIHQKARVLCAILWTSISRLRIWLGWCLVRDNQDTATLEEEEVVESSEQGQCQCRTGHDFCCSQARAQPYTPSLLIIHLQMFTSSFRSSAQNQSWSKGVPFLIISERSYVVCSLSWIRRYRPLVIFIFINVTHALSI